MGRINYGLFLAVVALLPFPQLFLRWAVVLWIITWFLEFRWLQISNIQYPISNLKLPFLLFGAWYIFKLLSGLWASDSAAWAWQMERYMTFGLLIPVGLWGVNEQYQWTTIGKTLVFFCVAAIPIWLLWMTALYLHPEIVPAWALQEDWIQHPDWWTFFSENISHFKHRLFLCSIELFGAIIAFRLYRHRLKVLIPTLLVMLSSIPLTTSRQSILTAVVLIAIGAIFCLPHKHRWVYGTGIALAGVALGITLLANHPRMQSVHIGDLTEMREMSYDHDIRYNIWGAALQHPSDYLAHGLGAGQSAAYLSQQYAEAGFEYYSRKAFHAHNQYLEELMEIGIPGLILFLIAWLSVPLCARKKGRQTAILFTTLFLLNMFTDCMFGKFCGIALWAVGMVLILLQSDSERDE